MFPDLKRRSGRFFLGVSSAMLTICAVHADDAAQILTADGLRQNVEIIRDKWGINHIYAQNQTDLFFAQGYSAAKDRLFQFEIWRRKATGTLAEILGEKALEHDKGARLLRFRHDLKVELAHYHQDSTEIITAFVAGVNAYIKETQKNPDLLPFEFTALGIKPGLWTAEIVISRHNALTGGIRNEVLLSKSISAIGAERTRQLFPFNRDAHLKPVDGVDLTKITDDITALYRASRSMPLFEETDLIGEKIASDINQSVALTTTNANADDAFWQDPIAGVNTLGSNNWVLAGSKTQSGKPLIANDPHRSIQSPSLRYMVHLHAPAEGGKKGWNVIGGGEPVLPGVSIGHNEYGAWGLTIFSIDQEDLYVYAINPDNPNQYWYQGAWEDMQTEATSIAVKGKEDVKATLKYSRHGPILYEDSENNLAYGLKAAWLDIGAAPYLASLRMDQATSFEEFRKACSYSGLPGENMVWADKAGTIGWQAVGLTPVRFGWDGSLPISGDGTYEWQGYVPILSMPHITNPKSGWYGTANENNVPEGYPNIFSDFYADPARSYRLRDVMTATVNHSIEDSKALQYDTKSMNAARITPVIASLSVPTDLQAAQSLLVSWDHRMDRHSNAAALYDLWEQAMLVALKARLLSPEHQALLPDIKRQKLTEWVASASPYAFGQDAVQTRNAIMVDALQKAVQTLKDRLGEDMTGWHYGDIHFAAVIHPLSDLLAPDQQKWVNTVALPRGGSSTTLNANRGAGQQTHGASFRMIVDTSDWDLAIGTNAPGQSGDPRSPYYKNLFENWNAGTYFPIYYSKDKIREHAGEILLLKP